MTATNKVDVPQLIHRVSDVMTKFLHAQGEMAARIRQIQQGRLLRGRVAIRVLVDCRDRARQECNEFFDNLSEDENNALAVAWGTKELASSGTTACLIPANDPQV